MLYLLDSDTARKLSQYNLIEELIHALQCEAKHLAILPQLKYQLGITLKDESKAFKKLGTQIAIDAARHLISKAQEVEIMSEASDSILNLSCPDLDSGEKTLLAALASGNDNELITGDKRALVAISKIDHMEILNNLWARILCLEEAILLLILRSHSFHSISNKIHARPDADTGISIIFGRSIQNDSQMVIEGLASFIRHLHIATSFKYVIPK